MNHRHHHARPLRRTASWVLGLGSLGAGAGVVFVGCGVDNEIVGGACDPGYTREGNACVVGGGDSGKLTDGGGDSSREVSTDSRADGTTDGPTDSKTVDGTTDTTTHDSPTSDGPSSDGADGSSGDSCVPPYDTVEHCGSCSVSCSAVDICSLGDAGTYGCVPLCAPPFSDCSSFCVNETNDPDNCGMCGKVCPSGFCSASKCEGSTAGDIIVIGHDYVSSTSTVTEAKIISNAAFLPASNPLQIFSFEEYADPTAVANVKAILNAEASVLGKTIKYHVSTVGTDIPTDLNITAYDELIVYDQESAAPGVLGPLGTSWASTLATFTSAGGVVIALDGAAGTTEQMPIFETNAGLLSITAHTVIAKNTPLAVVAPGDVVGHGVVTPYASELDSVFFTTSVPSSGNVTYVVVDPIDASVNPPVVIHVVVP